MKLRESFNLAADNENDLTLMKHKFPDVQVEDRWSNQAWDVNVAIEDVDEFRGWCDEHNIETVLI